MVKNALSFLLLLGLGSCNNGLEKKKEYYKEKFEVLKKTDTYKAVYSSASDTIKHWIDSELVFFYQFNSKVRWSKYEIDKWILFNSTKDKCLINLLIQSTANKVLDDVYFILGEKYQEKWWFYEGPDLTIIQENYIKDTAVYALPFSTLREIALKNTLSWYYIEKPAGTCLKKLFSEGYDSYKKCREEKYVINDQYFESGFNWDADRKNHSKFLNERFKPDSVTLNPSAFRCSTESDSGDNARSKSAYRPNRSTKFYSKSHDREL